MAMKCTHCGALLTAGAWSCAACGQKFSQPVPADPAPQAPPAQDTPPAQAPPYGAPPQPGPAPQYRQTPSNPAPQYGAPPPQGPPQYGQVPPPGQYTPPSAKKSNLPMALGIGCLALLIIFGLVARAIYTSAQKIIAEAPKSGTSTPVTTTPPLGGPPSSGPAVPPVATPPVAPPPALGAAGGSDEDNAKALAANMTKFGECLQRFGEINSHPRLADADWRQQMEQNAQEMKADIAEERQVTWPSALTPAKDNYENGLAEYGYLAEHWPAAVENGDMSALKDCQDHAERAKTLVLEAEAQIKQITGGGG